MFKPIFKLDQLKSIEECEQKNEDCDQKIEGVELKTFVSTKREKKQKTKKIAQKPQTHQTHQVVNQTTIKHEKSLDAFKPVDKTTLRKLEWHEKIRKYVYPWNKTEWFLCDWHSYLNGQGEPYITICRLIHPHELSEFLEDTKHFFGHIDYNAFDKNGIYNEKLRQSTLDPSAEWKEYFGCEPNENDVISLTLSDDQPTCHRFVVNGKNGIEFKSVVLSGNDSPDNTDDDHVNSTITTNTNTTNTNTTNTNKTIII